MRIKLVLETEAGSILPMNYYYPISSVIYKTLQKASTQYADWLHNQGYGTDHKQYKLFTFALDLPRFKTFKDRFILLDNKVELVISFYADEAIKNFIMGVFQQQGFTVADKHSKVDFKTTFVGIEPKPTFSNTMRYRCLSPICISMQQENKRYASYLHPEDPNFKTLFLENLLNKYSAAGENSLPPIVPENYQLDILSKPKSRLVTIKAGSKQETKIRGYLFDFKLTAPRNLHEFGYYAGFGEKTSGAGFGAVRVIL